ncbi:MAG: sialidase family protein [Chitinophagaceae bacterium]
MKMPFKNRMFIGAVFVLVHSQVMAIQPPQKLLSVSKVARDTLPYQVISKGGVAGDYQAFPDALRLKNGEILAAFYSGDSHITKNSSKYPNAGRICFVRSTDEGKTWSTPQLLYDDAEDNRDAHLSQLADGTVLCSFFNLVIDSMKHGTVRIVRSGDNGSTWSRSSQVVVQGWFCSAPAREMRDGSIMQPVYTIVDKKTNRTSIGFVKSIDKGISWGPVIAAGLESKFTVNETDVIELKDRSVYAAIRGHFKEKTPMQYTTSTNAGSSWSPLKDIGFYGDAPSFTRLSSGEILLSCRGYLAAGTPYTALQISSNEGKNWEGPYWVDKSPGAYPSTIELKDGSVMIIFYQEGAGSAIGALRFKHPGKFSGQQFTEPKLLERLSF